MWGLLPSLGRWLTELVLIGPCENAPYTSYLLAFAYGRSVADQRQWIRKDGLPTASWRAEPCQRRLYQRLRQAGKPPKLAFIAVARKLLVTLNAVARERHRSRNSR